MITDLTTAIYDLLADWRQEGCVDFDNCQSMLDRSKEIAALAKQYGASDEFPQEIS